MHAVGRATATIHTQSSPTAASPPASMARRTAEAKTVAASRGALTVRGSGGQEGGGTKRPSSQGALTRKLSSVFCNATSVCDFEAGIEAMGVAAPCSSCVGCGSVSAAADSIASVGSEGVRRKRERREVGWRGETAGSSSPRSLAAIALSASRILLPSSSRILSFSLLVAVVLL
eukprot:scaffold296646_cov33-Tisochrysis_lutea.AAC.7